MKKSHRFNNLEDKSVPFCEFEYKLEAIKNSVNIL
jgi:hypothetical protein